MKEEHEAISLFLALMKNICAQMEGKGNVDQDHLVRIVEVLKVFVDGHHHMKEEDLLFPAIIPSERKLIGILLGEHSQGRSYVRAMGQGFAHSRSFRVEVGARYVSNTKNFVTLMIQHIQKENNLLFPRLDRLLANKEQNNLADRFQELDERRKEIRQDFEKLLSELREIYPE